MKKLFIAALVLCFACNKSEKSAGYERKSKEKIRFQIEEVGNGYSDWSEEIIVVIEK